MSEYKTETVELKYCDFKTPWNIFEKFRGKRVFNVPNDLSLCVENPELILKSDYDELTHQNKILREQIKELENKNG